MKKYINVLWNVLTIDPYKMSTIAFDDRLAIRLDKSKQDSTELVKDLLKTCGHINKNSKPPIGNDIIFHVGDASFYATKGSWLQDVFTLKQCLEVR